MKKVTNNKAETVNPFLSDKIVSRGKVTLIEEDVIVENDINTVQILNTFFSNIIRATLKLQNMLTATLFQTKSTIQLNPF